ncbi:hydroxyisourate hydrolase [Pseudonocardia acaciae]|uniref:hydroxyisourate hydrolase n=1 Tax=Pseudonocardia acaciae TaxID=551276 RepID=UPI00048AB147|nr:hydroxyisourate hydrolase [Pseudonocardia acaciae]
MITTHVLDSARGRPAAGVPVRLERAGSGQGEPLGEARTDGDGRVRELGPATLDAGGYRLVFDTGAYFEATGQRGFYPEVAITFTVDAGEHYHVPLLLSPFAYSTYRGS